MEYVRDVAITSLPLARAKSTKTLLEMRTKVAKPLGGMSEPPNPIGVQVYNTSGEKWRVRDQHEMWA